jgi:hypothetical protein
MLAGVVAERLVVWVLPNLRMGDHTLAAMLDAVGHRLGSLRSTFSGVFVFNTLRWDFWFSVI